MKLSNLFATVLLASSSLLLSSTASAQDFEAGTAEDREAAAAAAMEAPEKGEWKANAQAGWILTTGNSSTNTLSAGFDALWKAKGNQLAIDGGGAYAKAQVFQFADDPTQPNGVADNASEITRNDIVTTKAWRIKARYDRFLAKSTSLYALGYALSDVPAGKQLVFGGQAGFSQMLINNDSTKLVMELGYDFSNENPVAGDSFATHSVRGFLGYSGVLSEDTSIDASVEGLTNVNQPLIPLLPDTLAAGNVDRFKDYRILGRAALTTKLRSNISFRFGFEARYDNAPNPFTLAGVTIDYLAAAKKLDTKTDASLIISFL